MISLFSLSAFADDLPQVAYGDTLSPYQSFVKDTFNVVKPGAVVADFTELPASVNKGDVLTVNFQVKYLHDSESSKFSVYWVPADRVLSPPYMYLGDWTWQAPHKQNDWVKTYLAGVKTATLPEGYCNKNVELVINHQSYYGGVWHFEGTIYQSITTEKSTLLKCATTPTCQPGTKIGSPACENNRIVQQYYQADCSIQKTVLDDCANRATASTCVVESPSTTPICKSNTPSCTAQLTGSPYCDGNNVVQDFQNSDCSRTKQQVQTCSSGCQNAQCVTQQCGNGVRDPGEGCNTCPADYQCLAGQYCDAATNQCASPPTAEYPLCNDVIDNDKNGLTDCADQSCKSAPNCQTPPPTDSDGDGVIDSYDNCPDTPKGLLGFGKDTRGCSFLQKYGWTSAFTILTIVLVIIGGFVLIRKLRKVKVK